VVGVDPDQPSLNLGGEAMSFTDVLRPQGRPEAILARVGQEQPFRLLLSHPSLFNHVLREKRRSN